MGQNGFGDDDDDDVGDGGDDFVFGLFTSLNLRGGLQGSIKFFVFFVW